MKMNLMKIRKHFPIAATFLAVGLWSSAHAALNINFGITGDTTLSGQGPTGANADYQAYATAHEQSDSGGLQTYNGISFTGLGGTYDVGVNVSWDGANLDTAKQAFNRGSATNYEFFDSWIGTDTRDSGDDTLTVTFTDLAANQSYLLTSYHFDGNNQTGRFKTNLTGDTEFDIGAEGDIAGTADDAELSGYIHQFSLTSDGAGTASIGYIGFGGTAADFFVMNGLDLQAVPEPSTALLGGLGMLMLLMRRRRCD